MRGQAPDETATKILDAASRVLADAGSRRTTVEHVAKSAGVSHMTIYRRWPSKTQLLRAAVGAEFARTVDEAFQAAIHPERDFAATVAAAFTEMVSAMRANPVLVQALAAEPEQFLAGSGPDAYSLMSDAVPMVAEQLQTVAGHALPGPLATTLADTVIRLAHSLLLIDYPEQSLDGPADLAAYAAQTVHPLALSIAEAMTDPDGTGVATAPPRRFGSNRSKITLVAASVAAALLASAGVTAALVRPADPTISPADLSGSQQSTVSTSSSTPPVVPPVRTVTPSAPPGDTAEEPDTATLTESEQPAPRRTPEPAADTNPSPRIGDRESDGDSADTEPDMGRRPNGAPPSNDRPGPPAPDRPTLGGSRPLPPSPGPRNPGPPPAGGTPHSAGGNSAGAP